MKTKNNNKGISLIVLIITITVMIIISGAIILGLNNTDIFNNTSESVDLADELTVSELAKTIWTKAYAAGVRTVEGDDGFQARIENGLKDKNVDMSKYMLKVTKSGVTVKLKSKMWIKTDGLEVVRNGQVLKIGDKVNYNAGVSTYTGDWQILGADDEGNLLIMSSTDIKTAHRLGYESTSTDKLEECKNDWLYAEKELDNICESYGHGTGAISARSVRVEDINQVAKYNPWTAESGKPYGNGKLYEYGSVVTYKYNGEETPAYLSSVVGGASLTTAHNNGFHYYNGKRIMVVDDLTTGEIDKELVTITNTYYIYYGPSLKTMDTESVVFKMIFGEYSSEKKTYTNNYWLASPFVRTDANCVTYGINYVGRGYVYRNYLWYSNGDVDSRTSGVRAVVTLSSDLKFTGSSETGWSY